MHDILEAGGRRHTRVRYPAGVVAVRAAAADPFVMGTLSDISVSGCQISVSSPLAIEVEQVIEVRIDLSTISFSTLGFVRRFNNAEGMIGIEFRRLSAAHKAELESFVEYYVEEL